MKSLLQGALRDEGQSYQGVSGGGEEELKGGCRGRANSGSGRNNGSNLQDGGGRTEERRGETPAEVSNWERMVDLVQATFG